MSTGSEAKYSAAGRAVPTQSHNPPVDQAQHDSAVEALAGYDNSIAKADPEHEEGDRAGSEEDAGNQGNTMQPSLTLSVSGMSCKFSA